MDEGRRKLVRLHGNDSSVVEEGIVFLLMTSQLLMLPQRNDKHPHFSR